MNDYNYSKLRLSLNVVSLKICKKKGFVKTVIEIDLLVFRLLYSFDNSFTEETHNKLLKLIN